MSNETFGHDQERKAFDERQEQPTEAEAVEPSCSSCGQDGPVFCRTCMAKKDKQIARLQQDNERLKINVGAARERNNLLQSNLDCTESQLDEAKADLAAIAPCLPPDWSRDMEYRVAEVGDEYFSDVSQTWRTHDSGRFMISVWVRRKQEPEYIPTELITDELAKLRPEAEFQDFGQGWSGVGKLIHVTDDTPPLYVSDAADVWTNVRITRAAYEKAKGGA